MNFISINGKIQPGDLPALLVSNRGYRYGDGLFETIRVVKGNILLETFHFERLFSGLSLLRFEVPKLFTAGFLAGEIRALCHKNGCTGKARVRLSVFRGHGGLYEEDKTLQYVLECSRLEDTADQLNENGLVIGVFTDIRKNGDVFSNLKSASFLPYNLAALYAKENKLNDCLVLNTGGNIADSTIANIFIIKDGAIMTPALQEGCVSGVMRKYLVGKLLLAGYTLRETVVTISDLEQADEIFLTNAIKGMRWVKQCGSKVYTNTKSTEIFNRFVKTISP